MSYWLNSSNGINCATCGREVHTSKCFGKKGFIRVDLNCAERAINDYYDRTDIPSCTVEFCSLPCLKNADWDKIYADFIKFEDETMVKDYYAKHGTHITGLEKSLIEQDVSEIPPPFFEPKPEPIVEAEPERIIELIPEAIKGEINDISPKTEPIIEIESEPLNPQSLIGLKEPKLKSKPEIVAHCGMCDCDWVEGHEKTEKHIKLEKSFSSKMRDFRMGGGALNNTIAEIFVKDAKTEESVEVYKDTGMFKDIGMAYAIIEMYDYGSVDKRTYRNAVKFILEETKKKYGTDDYRYRELFALSHRGQDNWEGTFDVRALCHAISLNCPHTQQKDCERSRTPFEEAGEQACEQDKKNLPNYKRGKCSHCRHLERIKEKWEKKGL
jgi:hypothetical protein